MTSAQLDTVNDRGPEEKFLPQLSDSSYAMAVSALFLLLGGIIAWHHEMWRDEMQAWLIARDSASPIEVLYHLNQYDGHPGLWHLCLYVLKLITRSPIIMQPFHLIIAAISAYVFLRFSPFTRLQKTLFVFGYLPFYEYAIICRNYALGVLLLFLFCALFRNWRRTLPLLGFILLLMSHTSVHALIIVISISIGLCWEIMANADRPPRREIGIGFGMILFGIVTAIIQLKPSGPNLGISTGWRTEFELNYFLRVLNILPKAFLPIPDFTLRFWNTYLLDKLPGAHEVKCVLAVLICLFALFLFIRKPMAFLMYLFGTIGLLAFFYSKRFGFIRHWGFLFMAFIAANWLCYYCRDLPKLKFNLVNRLNGISLGLVRNLGVVLTVLLVLHLVGGVAAAIMDYKYPFSGGKAVAQFIKSENLDEMIIAAEAPDDVTLEILGYSEKDTFYYPRTKRFGSFIPWDVTWGQGRGRPTEEVLQEIRRLSNERREDILVVSGRIFPDELRMRHSLTEVKVFAPSVVRESLQNYVLYRMTPMGPSEAKIDALSVVGLWGFDEGEGNITRDFSGNDNNGTLIGNPEWVEGKFGAALEFDGIDDYVDCGNAQMLRIPKGTMMAWMKVHTDKDSGLSAVTLPFGDSRRWEPPFRSLGLGAVQGEPVFWIAINAENKEFLSGGLRLHQWHHMAITYDGGMRRGYIDGEEVFGYVFRGEIEYSGDPTCVIGTRGKESPGEFFNGAIDEVAIFSEALSNDQIRAVMKDGIAQISWESE